MTGRHPYTFYIDGRQPFEMTGACTMYSMDIDVSTFIPYTLPFCSVPDFTEPTFVPRLPEQVAPDLIMPDLCQCITHEVTINRVFGVANADGTFAVRITRVDGGDCCDQQFLLDADLQIPCIPFNINCNLTIDRGAITGRFTRTATCDLEFNLSISLPDNLGITVEIGTVDVSVGLPVDFTPEIEIAGMRRIFNYHAKFPSCPSCPSCCVAPGTWLTWHDTFHCTIDHVTAFDGSIWLGLPRPPPDGNTRGVLEGHFHGNGLAGNLGQLVYPTYHNYMHMWVEKYWFDYNYGHLLNHGETQVTSAWIHFMECNDINITPNATTGDATYKPYLKPHFAAAAPLAHGTCNYAMDFTIAFPKVCVGTWLTIDSTDHCIEHQPKGAVTDNKTIYGLKRVAGLLHIELFQYEIQMNYHHVMNVVETDSQIGGYLCDETCFTCADYAFSVHKTRAGCGTFYVAASNKGKGALNKCVFGLDFSVVFPHIDDITKGNLISIWHDPVTPCLHHIEHECSGLYHSDFTMTDINWVKPAVKGMLEVAFRHDHYYYTCGHLYTSPRIYSNYLQTFWYPDMLIGDGSGLISILHMGPLTRMAHHHRYKSYNLTIIDTLGNTKILEFLYGHLLTVIDV